MSSRSFRLFVSLALLLLVMYFFSTIIIWTVIAWVLSLMGRPIINFLSNLHIGRFKLGASFCAIVTIIVFYLGFGGLILTFAPPIIHQTSNLAKANYSGFSHSVNTILEGFNHHLLDWGLITDESLKDSTEVKKEAIVKEHKRTVSFRIDSLLVAKGDSETHTNLVVNVRLDEPAPITTGMTTAESKSKEPWPEQIKKSLFKFFDPSSMFSVFSNILSTLGNLMVAWAAITFILFFFLKEPNLFENIILALVATEIESDVKDVLERIRQLLTRYFIGVLLEMIGITIFCWVLLTVLGVPNALLLGFMAALLNTIPYLGSIIAMVFGAMLCITSGLNDDFYTVTIWHIVKVFSVFYLMQKLDAYLLQPLIYSRTVIAHPLEIFIVIILGAQLAGIPGMVVAVPAYTVLRIIAAEFLSKVKVIQRLTARLSEKMNESEQNNATKSSEEGTETK